jgi:polysaccharide biosynthesis/export protein
VRVSLQFGCKHTCIRTLFLLALITSCSSTKKSTYFEDLKNSSQINSQIITAERELKLQAGDVVQILINSLNPEATSVFNLGNSTPAFGATSRQVQGRPDDNLNLKAVSDPTGSHNGYLIDTDGEIDFPVLGKLKVSGLTTRQFKEQLKIQLDRYLTEPIVNVRLLNYTITVIGEVTHPASYTIPGEQITVIEALGLAGDLTIYGKRENVLLVREEGGKRMFIRLNLNSSDLFKSPYYYLKQKDALYVEADPSKFASLDNGFYRKATLVVSVLTLVTLIAYRVF